MQCWHLAASLVTTTREHGVLYVSQLLKALKHCTVSEVFKCRRTLTLKITEQTRTVVILDNTRSFKH